MFTVIMITGSNNKYLHMLEHSPNPTVSQESLSVKLQFSRKLQAGKSETSLGPEKAAMFQHANQILPGPLILWNIREEKHPL